MAVRVYKPTSNGRRNMSVSTFEEITCTTPEKSLLAPHKKNAGRNNSGRITVRHQGGGVKQKYRIIDFKRNKFGIPGRVATIEYDPNRSANIALVVYKDGEKRYILAPKGLKVNDVVMSGKDAEIRTGNALPINLIPVGALVHNIELHPGKGGQLIRSAGASAQILGREDNYVLLRLMSGEVRKVLATCLATIGEVGNETHELVNIHGGGEGKSPVGRPSPVTPWGKPALGLKTRKHKKASNKLIVRRRNDK